MKYVTLKTKLFIDTPPTMQKKRCAIFCGVCVCVCRGVRMRACELSSCVSVFSCVSAVCYKTVVTVASLECNIKTELFVDKIYKGLGRGCVLGIIFVAFV